MTNFFHTLSHLFRGQTMLRILMNRALGDETIRGKVVDIGGGRNPDYFEYFKKVGHPAIEALDGSLSGIDFEKDALPHEPHSVDTVILCNVLEHIYNHKHLLSEINRIMKNGASLIGFVPFMVGYHPDPHDYFRYTPEALRKIFGETGFKDVRIQPIGNSPILANFNTLVLSVPRIVRPLMYLWYRPLDIVFGLLRPRSRERNPLGYIFVVTK